MVNGEMVHRFDGISWRWVKAGSLADVINQDHTEREQRKGGVPPEEMEPAKEVCA